MRLARSIADQHAFSAEVVMAALVQIFGEEIPAQARIQQVIANAVSHFDEEKSLSVTVSTEDYELIREVEFGPRIKFLPSKDLTSGGCHVEDGETKLDASIETVFDRLYQTLSASERAAS
ncbi:MAG: FliH/SctL family protein [Pseudomonadota bacterium]